MKCDETRPACRRCATLRRVCGGYETTDAEQSLTWYRPTQLAAHDPVEGRAFQFFSRIVGPVLSGPTDGYFWTHLVLQFSHFEPSVRHAVLSISSLYENFSNGSRISRQLRTSPFAIAHYNAAIGRIKSANNEQFILLVCILFVCIEYLQGDVEAALQHCRYGITILNSSECCSWVREHLVPIFRRLSLIPFFFDRAPFVALPSLAAFDAPNTAHFSCVAEAQAAIDNIMSRILDYRASGSDADKQQLMAMLHHWGSRADSLEMAIPPSRASDRYSMCGMKIKHKVAYINLQTPWQPTELWFDRYLESFRSIVDMAQTAAQLKVLALQSTTSMANFTFEMSFLPLLFFVVIKCRHLQTRLEALSLMVQLSTAKEGLFDVGTLYRVGRRHIEIEHDISLDDDHHYEEIGGPDVTDLLPPEQKRAFAAPVNHELETYLDKDGAVRYRRQVRFLSRDQNGQVLTRIEYITDDKPRGSSLQVPNLRSAH